MLGEVERPSTWRPIPALIAGPAQGKATGAAPVLQAGLALETTPTTCVQRRPSPVAAVSFMATEFVPKVKRVVAKLEVTYSKGPPPCVTYRALNDAGTEVSRFAVSPYFGKVDLMEFESRAREHFVTERIRVESKIAVEVSRVEVRHA